MAEPSRDAIGRAAKTLSCLSEIAGLEGAIAVFRGEQLERVRWYEVTECGDRLDGGISGAQLPEVMERMRHRDERMTLRVYAKVMKSRHKAVDAGPGRAH